MKKLLLTVAMTTIAGIAFAQGPNESGTYYQAADGKSGAALKTTLSKIINPHTNIGYDGLFKAYESTDRRPDGKVRDWYSATTNYSFSDHGGYRQEGDSYNREHTVPQSWFGSGIIKSDVIQVVPTDGYVNNRRSNYPFGEVLNATYTSNQGYCKLGSCKTEGYSGTVFEPNDEIKGDLARIYFYMVTCYESQAAGWGHGVFSNANQGFENWAVKMLMRWAKQDPVDDRETKRNMACYACQKNRNPFVDYPGLEDYIWGDKKTTAFSYDRFEGGSSVEIPVVAMPVFSQDAGTYYDSISVELSCATEGAVIYYTTNGTEPTAQSTRYDKAISISKTTTIKAVAIKGGVTSWHADATFIIMEAGSQEELVPAEDGTIQLCDDLFGTGYAGPINTNDTQDLEGTQNGVNIVYGLGSGQNRYCNSSQIRLYPGNELKLSVTDGDIVSLEFLFAEGSPYTTLMVGGQDLQEGKWSGQAKTVTVMYGGTKKHARLDGVKIGVSGSAGVKTVSLGNQLTGKRVVYNLRGQRVANPANGLYFVDRKKVIIK